MGSAIEWSAALLVASTRPRSDDRGVSLSQQPSPQPKYMLQRGRGRMTAECLAMGRRPPRHAALQRGRGRMTAECKKFPLAPVEVGWLQRGRGRMTAECSLPDFHFAFPNFASTRPRSDDRGVAAAAALFAPFFGDASTRPRSDDRGVPSLLVFPPPRLGCFNEAAVG